MVNVFLSLHGQTRAIERKIDIHEAKKIAKQGKIVKIDKDGSLIKEGVVNGRKLMVICKDLGKKGIMIITTYYEY